MKTLAMAILCITIQTTLAASVKLAWDYSDLSRVDHFVVYTGTNSGTYTRTNHSDGTNTTLTLSGMEAGITYFMAATTVNTNGLQSTFSNEIAYTAPVPPMILPPGSRSIRGAAALRGKGALR